MCFEDEDEKMIDSSNKLSIVVIPCPSEQRHEIELKFEICRFNVRFRIDGIYNWNLRIRFQQNITINDVCFFFFLMNKVSVIAYP